MTSPKHIARIAGILYLLVAIFAGFAFSMHTKLYVAGNAATTTANIVANSGLVRMAVVADLIQATSWTLLALTLYKLFKHVHPSAAHTMVVFVAIGAGIVCLNTVFAFEAMQVATSDSYAASLGAASTNNMVLMLFDIQHYGFFIASVFYGLWLVPLGYLVYKSGLLPKAMGIALIIACVSYHADLLAAFLAPSLSAVIHSYLSIPPIIAEVWMLIYLLAFGVRTVKPDMRAQVAL